MALFKWRLTHKADTDEIKQLILDFGFKPIEDNPHRFVKAVAYHREVKIGVRSEEVIFYVHKEMEAASDTYFEYLFEAGHYNGRLASAIEELPVRGDGSKAGDSIDDYETLKETKK